MLFNDLYIIFKIKIKATTKPMALGFGISTDKQVKHIIIFLIDKY
jgi:tryptophan synthase alpha subunit